MEEAGVDGLLGTTFEQVLYLCNVWVEGFFWGPRQTQAFAVVQRDRLDRPVLAAGIGEVANFANSAAEGAELITYGDFYRFVEPGADLDDLATAVKDRVVDHKDQAKPNAVEALVCALEAAGLTTGTVAYDERGLFLETQHALRQRLPDLRLVPGYQLFRRIRAVKTEEEQRRLEEALRIDEGAISAAMKVARPGIREQDMIAELETFLVRHGAKPLFSQICFGGRGGMGNVMQRDGVLHEGEVIRFDIGIMAGNGYHSDIARNFSLGEPDERAVRYWDATLAGIDAAAMAMKRGAIAADVFHAAVAAVRQAGIPHFNRNHVGHGIGLEVYDMPLLAPGDTTPIEEGMVFQVETPYYELGWAGIQPEDTIVATVSGGRNLARLSRRFEVV